MMVPAWVWQPFRWALRLVRAEMFTRAVFYGCVPLSSWMLQWHKRPKKTEFTYRTRSVNVQPKIVLRERMNSIIGTLLMNWHCVTVFFILICGAFGKANLLKKPLIVRENKRISMVHWNKMIGQREDWVCVISSLNSVTHGGPL